MSARIIDFAEVKSRRACARFAASLGLDGFDTTVPAGERLHFWAGQSGKRYVHTIYNLVECPSIPASNYVLVHRDTLGRRTALSFGRATHKAASLNLAEIRHLGASLGANEVHVHLLAESAADSLLIEADLRNSAAISGGLDTSGRAVGQSHH
jgi:hypothetical protein